MDLYAWKYDNVILYTDTPTPATLGRLYKANGEQYTDDIIIGASSCSPYIHDTDGSTYITLLADSAR